MSGQGLEGSGALNIRWAYQDQNPTAQAEKAEEQQHAVLTAAERRGIFGDEGSKRQSTAREDVLIGPISLSFTLFHSLSLSFTLFSPFIPPPTRARTNASRCAWVYGGGGVNL